MSVFRFLRRPFLRGNTNSLVQGPPTLRTEVRRDDATLKFLAFEAAGLPARLSVRVTIGGVDTLRTVPLPSAIINDVVTALNTPITGLVDATASDEGGFLVITGNGIGDGAQLRIEPFVGAFPDAAPTLEFPIHPDPLATSDGGDRSYSPPGLNELNPLGTAFATGGEDVTSGVLNRAIDALAYNADYLSANLDRLIALPMVIDSIDPTAAPWSTRVVTDGGGNVQQINLGGISAIDSGLSDRVYLGKGLSPVSTLQQLSQYFAVMEEGTLAEMLVGPRTVRVSAATHGERVAPAPVFADEVTPPIGPVPAIASWPLLDGGNLLGLTFLKTGPVGIGEVVYNTAARVPTATFQADGVSIYDRVEISGAAVDVPFNHDGTYQVEDIYSEELILLRGAVPEDRGELNDAVGVLGDLEVYANDEFAEDVWLTFDPPIPAGKTFRLVVGGGYQLRTLPTDYLLKLAISSSEEVDSLVQQVIQEMKGPLVDSTDDFTEAPFAHSVPGNPFVYEGPLDGAGKPLISMEFLHRRTTLQGAYDGQGLGGGGGYFVNVDWNAPEWNNRTPAVARAHTGEGLSGTGATILAGNVLYDPGQEFTIDEVGQQILITSKVSGALRLRAAFVVIDYIDSEHLVLEPGEWNPTIPAGGDYGYTVVSGRFDGFPAAMSTHVLQSASYGRLGYVHEEDRVASSHFGHHMLAVRESTTHTDPAVLEELRHFIVEFSVADAADGWVHVGFDPSASSNIRAFGGAAPFIGSQSVLRLTDTENNDGWFLITDVDGFGMRVRVSNLNGVRPVFVISVADGGRGHLYNQPQGFTLTQPIDGFFVRVGHSFFEDAIESAASYTLPEAASLLAVMSVDWRGKSSGYFAFLNDSDFLAYKRGDPAVGPVTNFSSYMPGNGVQSWHNGAALGEDLTPSGAALATPRERGGFAGAFLAETNSMDRALTGPLPAMKGSALYAAQIGADAALVVVGSQRAISVLNDPVEPDDVTFVDGRASIVATREDEWSMLQSGTGEFMGALYQWDPREFWPTEAGSDLHNMYGGFYSEMAMASRFSNSPMSTGTKRYYEVDAQYGTKLSRLGQPGQVLPSSYTVASAFAVDLMAPNPAKSRSHKTSGFLLWTGVSNLLIEDPSAYIGQQVLVNADDDTLDGLYVIINVGIDDSGGDPEYLVEVYRPGKVFATSIGGGDEATVLGNRWYHANVDVENFALLGTRRADGAAADLHDLALIGGTHAFDLDGLPKAARRDYGNGMGILDLGAPAWALGGSPGTETSRHPIANEGWHAGTEPFDVAAANLMTFSVGEWVFRVTPGPVVTFRTDFEESFQTVVGGNIRLDWNLSGGGAGAWDASTVYGYLKVSKTTFLRHYAYRVSLRLKQPATTVAATKTVTVALVDGIGGSLISLEKSFTMDFNAGEEYAAALDFDSSEMGFDLREEPTDALEDSSEVYLRIGLGWVANSVYPGNTLDFHVFQAAVENLQKGIFAGHLQSTGMMISAGFEGHTKAMDWKSYGPESAGPYGSIGYGDIKPYNLKSPGTGLVDPPIVQRVRVANTPDIDFYDLMSPSTFWFRGRNDASFNFMGAKFAPPPVVAGSTIDKGLDNAANRRGGMVGHIVALDPPNGSILSALHVVTSIFPAATPVVVGGVTPKWCVFTEVECTPGTPPIITAKEGFFVELWRQSVMPTENFPQEPLGGPSSITEVVNWRTFGGGFAELIHQEEVDLSGTVYPGEPGSEVTDRAALAVDCTSIGVALGHRDDVFFLTKIDLRAVHDQLRLQVDRRQYSYFIVIKAWGVGSSLTELSTYDDIDTAFYPGGTPGAFRWGILASATSSLDWENFTRFRFRGATLGCEYTRYNP